MDKVQKYKSFNTNTPSSESYRNSGILLVDFVFQILIWFIIISENPDTSEYIINMQVTDRISI
jgi:hypothetical protein